MTNKRWVFKPNPGKDRIDHLSKAINVSAPIAKILCQRGIENYEQAKDFFNPSLDQLIDPFLMKDMEKAVTRISQAMHEEEHILVYGDYDVDGTTSVALFYGFLNSFYDRCDFYIPDRYKEGYGVSRQGIDWAAQQGFTLVISLDCGIKSVDLIDYARDKGIDFIVCDHHLPGEVLPPAVAILDPKRKDCSYPFKELPGCGIGFKLAQAMKQRDPSIKTDPLSFLDLVAVSIASDIVPIHGENRILTYYGLQRLNKEPRPGLKALKELAGIQGRATVTHIVFGLAPRINAAGRISHAKTAVHLLLAAPGEEANDFAGQLNTNNDRRKDFDQGITQEALNMIEEDPVLQSSKTTVLFKNDWHKGVIGIVASRCIEKYHRPTIILTESNNMATGSARSVPGFNVYNAIDACSDLLEQYGGHKYAAGLSLKLEHVEVFRKRFEEVVADSIPGELLIPQLDIDSSLALDYITPNFFNVTERMAPFGPENLRPVFASEGCRAIGTVSLLKEKHLKFYVHQVGSSQRFEAIAFGQAEHFEALADGEEFSMVFSIEENEYKGLKSIQLNVKDIRYKTGKAGILG